VQGSVNYNRLIVHSATFLSISFILLTPSRNNLDRRSKLVTIGQTDDFILLNRKNRLTFIICGSQGFVVRNFNLIRGADVEFFQDLLPEGENISLAQLQMVSSWITKNVHFLSDVPLFCIPKYCGPGFFCYIQRPPSVKTVIYVISVCKKSVELIWV
jgi:hypothetical protein